MVWLRCTLTKCGMTNTSIHTHTASGDKEAMKQKYDYDEPSHMTLYRWTTDEWPDETRSIFRVFFLSASVSLSLYSPLSIVHLSIFNRSSQSLGWSLAHLVSANDYNIVCVINDTCIEYTFEPGLCETCLRVYDVRCPMINQSRWCARNDLHRCGLWSISLVTGHCAVGIRSWIHSGRRVALQRHSIYIVYISILLLLKIIDREQSVAIFLFHACYARGMPLKPISSHTAHNTNTKNWLQNNEEQ